MLRLTPAFILFIGLAMGASTASAQAVQQSGATFHRAVCPGPAAPGQARCHAHIVTDRAGNALVNRDRAGRPRFTNNATPAGLSATDLQSAYATTSLSATQGGGMIIAVVDAYGYPNAESDLGVYRAQFGLPPCTAASGCFRKVNQRGGQSSYPNKNTGWDQEQAIDIEMVSAICPNCRVLLVETDSASFGDLAARVNTAASLGAHAISNSYGGSEKNSQPWEQAYNHPGVAITVSSGDNGIGPEFPATSPHVTTVGGTSLVKATNARGWSETTWSGSGSGCSAVYPKPTWQTDALCMTRMEADTSAVADPNTGVATYGPVSAAASGWLVFGGTSVSSPITAGVYGLNGHAVNYGQNPYLKPGSLYDVTTGSNGKCGGTYFCNAGPGYDGPTGLGTPNGAAAF